MKPIISIIIPVYNVEKYLRKCLDSCINQTVKNIEIIVVNDCSPDNSAEIMKEYEVKYPGLVKCIYLEKNIKLGGARNKGLEIAQGKYIMFVDSDDYIANDMCEKLYNSITSNDADIVICDSYRVIEDNFIYLSAFSSILKSQCNISKQILFDNMVQKSAWGKLYKKEMLSEYLFPEHLYYEDLAVVFVWLLKVNKINYLAEPLYYYLFRDNSIMNVYEYLNKIQETTAIIKLIENLKTSEIFDIYEDEISDYILFVISKFIQNYFVHFLTHLHNDINLFINYIKENISNWHEKINSNILLVNYEKELLNRIFSDDTYINKIYEKNKLHINKKNIAIWGTGVWGKNVHNFVKQFKVKPVCFIDSNIEKQGNYIDNVEIISFEKAKSKCDTIIIAIKNIEAYKEIKALIEKENEKIKVKHYSDLFML